MNVRNLFFNQSYQKIPHSLKLFRLKTPNAGFNQFLIDEKNIEKINHLSLIIQPQRSNLMKWLKMYSIKGKENL